MTDTAQYGLPLVAAAQAQKHVTVNEALVRLDALTRLRLASASLAAPPVTAMEGESYLVATGGQGAWLGHDNEIAFFANGGWSFAQPRAGWLAHELSTGISRLFDGTEWIADALVATEDGSATLHTILQFDHAIGAGAVSVTVTPIPANTLVLGVTARVIVAMGGTATAWTLGVAGSANRYGSGLGLALNSHALGLTGSPLAYYADTPLELAGTGGTLSGGVVRIAVHVLGLRPPRAV